MEPHIYEWSPQFFYVFKFWLKTLLAVTFLITLHVTLGVEKLRPREEKFHRNSIKKQLILFFLARHHKISALIPRRNARYMLMSSPGQEFLAFNEIISLITFHIVRTDYDWSKCPPLFSGLFFTKKSIVIPYYEHFEIRRQLISKLCWFHAQMDINDNISSRATLLSIFCSFLLTILFITFFAWIFVCVRLCCAMFFDSTIIKEPRFNIVCFSKLY